MKNTLYLGFFLWNLIQTFASAGVIFNDNFSGNGLSSDWVVNRGYADVNNGYVELYGSTSGTRDGFINTHIGDSSWTDYHLTTHFIADGGGNNWYDAFVQFRVESLLPGTWGDGNYYSLFITTPLWGSNEGASWTVLKTTGHSWVSIASGALDPSVVPINDFDNIIDIWANGNSFMVAINGYSLTNAPIVDTTSNPYLTGGVGLGAIWESHTRFDYVTVSDLTATQAVPEPSALLLIVAGIAFLTLISRSGSP